MKTPGPIVSQYSVVVLLEVRDPDGNVMKRFHTQLNLLSGNQTRPYMMVLSPPVGRNNHMERFAFFYRQDEMSVIHRYMYEEENGDVFAREPFIVQFKRGTARVVKNLVLIAIHTKPQDAEHELRALHNVVQDARDKCKTDSIMILGDFNADRPYLSDTERENLTICAPPYFWLIAENADTTVSPRNDHTYDRIVVFGKRMNDAVVPGSAKPFDFQRAFRLNDDTARSISDHYPVEVELWDN